MPLSRDQLALIHVAKDRVGMGDDDYRAMLSRVGGVESSKHLDAAGFTAVMGAFERLGFVSVAARRNFGNRPGMASAGQVKLIRKLWRDYAAAHATDMTLGRWLERSFKVSSIRFVTAETAPKAITAFLARYLRGQGESSRIVHRLHRTDITICGYLRGEPKDDAEASKRQRAMRKQLERLNLHWLCTGIG